MRKRTSLIVAAGIAIPVLAGTVVYIVMNHHPRASAAEVPSAKVAVAATGDIAHTLSLPDSSSLTKLLMFTPRSPALW